MTPAPEALARRSIDDLLTRAGWVVADADQVDLAAARGVAIREFPLAGGGFADYLLYVDGRACGVIEAKKQGATLTGVEVQSARYQQGLPPALPAWRRPLPFAYESTGVETHFTNGLDPDAGARNVFAFDDSTAMIFANTEADSLQSPVKARLIDQECESSSPLMCDSLSTTRDSLKNAYRP